MRANQHIAFCRHTGTQRAQYSLDLDMVRPVHQNPVRFITARCALLYGARGAAQTAHTYTQPGSASGPVSMLTHCYNTWLNTSSQGVSRVESVLTTPPKPC